MYPCELDGCVQNLQRARLYRVGEPDCSTTRARFLTLAQVSLGVRAFFAYNSRHRGRHDD